MLGALLLAIPLRRNVPVALVTTLYTNPFTIVPLYVLAYGYGQLLLPGERAALVAPPEVSWDWMIAHGKALAVGLLALASTLALVGYVAVQIAWRVYVVSAWRARHR